MCACSHFLMNLVRDRHVLTVAIIVLYAIYSYMCHFVAVIGHIVSCKFSNTSIYMLVTPYGY